MSLSHRAVSAALRRFGFPSAGKLTRDTDGCHLWERDGFRATGKVGEPVNVEFIYRGKAPDGWREETARMIDQYRVSLVSCGWNVGVSYSAGLPLFLLVDTVPIPEGQLWKR